MWLLFSIFKKISDLRKSTQNSDNQVLKFILHKTYTCVIEKKEYKDYQK